MGIQLFYRIDDHPAINNFWSIELLKKALSHSSYDH